MLEGLSGLLWMIIRLRCSLMLCVEMMDGMDQLSFGTIFGVVLMIWVEVMDGMDHLSFGN